MVDPLFEQDDASTPLTPEEREGLIPAYITLRRELNEAEQNNVLAADQWAFARRRDVLSEQFLLKLHKRMFGSVWKWAGRFRTTGRNIGVNPYQIGVDLTGLLDDTRYWVANSTFQPDEIGARFHHRLVFIHPFPNGNGRHARLACDLLLVALGQRRFSWGSNSLVSASQTRRAYVDALRLADRHDYGALLMFVRS